MKKVLISALLLAATVGPSQATVRNFYAPQWQGAALDACLADGASCGKPVADAFCQAEGYDGAILFQRTAAARTTRLDGGEACQGPSCMSFRQIKCITSKDDFEGSQALVEIANPGNG